MASPVITNYNNLADDFILWKYHFSNLIPLPYSAKLNLEIKLDEHFTLSCL